MKFPIAFSVLLFALASAQSGSDIWEPEYTVDSETMQEAITVMEENNAIERYIYFTNNNTKEQISSRFCNQQNETNPIDFEQCEWSHWAEGLLWTAAVPLVSAIVLPILLKVFLCMRCCCCGTYKATVGVCGGKRRKGKHGYGCMQRWVFRVLIIGMVVMFFTVMTVGEVVSAGIKNGVSDSLGYANQTVSDLFGALERADGVLQNMGFSKKYPDMDAVMEQLFDVKAHIDNGFNTVNRYVDKFMGYVTTVITVVTIIPLALTVLALIGSLISCHQLLCPFLILATPMIFFGLISGGLFTPVSIGISDACYAIEQLKTVEDVSTLHSALSILSCDPNNNQSLAGYARQIDSIIDEAIDAACAEWQTYCDTEFPCMASETNTTIVQCKLLDCEGLPACSRDTIFTYLNNTLKDYKLGCYEGRFEIDENGEVTKISDINMIDGTTCPMNASKEVDLNNIDAYCAEFGELAPDDETASSETYDNRIVMASICNGGAAETISAEACSTECSMSILRTLSANATSLMKMAEDALTLYENDIEPLLDCHAATDLIYDVTDLVCAGTFMHFTPLARTLLVIGYGAFIGKIIILMAIKRANRKYRKKHVRDERDTLLDDDDDEYERLRR